MGADNYVSETMKLSSLIPNSLLTLAFAATVTAAQTAATSDPATRAANPQPPVPRRDIVGAPPVRVGLLYDRKQAKRLAAGDDKLKSYVQAITENGGTTCALSPALTAAQTGERVQSLDALLIPGGNDVDPALYHEKPDKRLEQTDPEFDRYVGKVVSQAVARGIPVLGICRGDQFLNVWAGGSLWQDLPTRPPSGTNVVHRIPRPHGEAAPCYHEITIQEGSFMFRLFKTRRLKVNSYHQQGVKTLAPRFHPVAWSDDGLVEAFEDDSGKIAGVQFHPEKERGLDPAFNSVFVDFISRAAQARTARPAAQ